MLNHIKRLGDPSMLSFERRRWGTHQCWGLMDDEEAENGSRGAAAKIIVPNK